MDATEVITARLANLRLSVPGDSPADVADWCGALQAQDLSSGKWSLGARLPRATEADVDQALATGEVLRTWPMRGTIHIVHPANAHWMLDLTGRRALNGLQARWDYLGLDKATVERGAEVLGEALQGIRMTRTQCLTTLNDAGIDTSGQRAYHLLWYASQIGVTCIGPNEGKEQTFVLLDDWATDPRTPSRDEALALLARMYFQSHGPASRADFQRWTGLTATDSKKAIAGADLGAVRALRWAGFRLSNPVTVSRTDVAITLRPQVPITRPRSTTVGRKMPFIPGTTRRKCSGSMNNERSL